MKNLIILSLLLMSGCTVVENYTDFVTEQTGLRFLISDEQRLVKYAKQCKKLGYEEKTKDMEECIIRRFELNEGVFKNRLGR
jgi:hypothetical protein